MARRGSLAEPEYGIHPADNVTAGVRRIGFPDVGERFRISEDVYGLLKLREVLWADENCCRVAVTGQYDPLVLTLHAIDVLREMVTDVT
jgi:hypothetical protein